MEQEITCGVDPDILHLIYVCKASSFHKKVSTIQFHFRNGSMAHFYFVLNWNFRIGEMKLPNNPRFTYVNRISNEVKSTKVVKTQTKFLLIIRLYLLVSVLLKYLFSDEVKSTLVVKPNQKKNI
jgi:hypothetical protein